MAASARQRHEDTVLSSLSLHQLERAVSMIPMKQRADAWHSFAESYEDNSSHPERWDRAVYCYQKAAEMSDEETRPVFLSHLSLALLARADLGVSSERDTGLAADAAMEARNLARNDDPYLKMFKANHGEALFRLWQYTGNVDDFEAAYDAIWSAICSAKDEDGQLIKQWYGKLRQEMYRRAEATNTSDDVNKALALFGTDTPDFHDDVDLQYYYATLLLMRHLDSGSSIDLIQSEQTVDYLLNKYPGGANHGSILSLQAHNHRLLARRSRKIEHCEKAIGFLDMSLAWFKEHGNLSSQDRAALLGSKAATLICRYNLSGEDRRENVAVPNLDLDHAIELARQAVELSSANASHETGNLLGSLGSALSCRYTTKLPLLADLDEATSAFERALKLQKKFFHAQTLASLGSCRRDHAKRTDRSSDWELVIQAYEKGAECIESPVYYRICAADDGGNLIYQRDPARALRLFETAVELLPHLSPASLSFSDKERNLAPFDAIAWSAASACLETTGDVYRAIRSAEIGRCTTADLRLNFDMDINALEEQHEKLAQRFRQARSKLRSTGFSYEDSLRGVLTALNNVQSEVDNLNTILDEIHGQPGFETFLRCPSESQLLALAQPGPLVLFCITRIRSDALLITKDGLKSVVLSRLKYSDMLMYAEQLTSVLKSQSVKLYPQNSKQMKNVLSWLWDAAVSPVLNELGYTTMPKANHEWPQVWWIRSGIFSAFPLHAAGYHDTAPRVSAIDRVISSYTPTIKSLQHARRSKVSKAEDPQRILILGMPFTTGQDDLPAVVQEVSELEKMFPPEPATTARMTPTYDQAVDLIGRADIFHFSGHGLSSTEDPLKSCLLMQDWKTKPLTISRLLDLDSLAGGFAYLSACHSGGSPNSELTLLDESLHISSAFQLIGFRSVVATLWYCHMNHSKTVASQLYKYMMDESRTVLPQRAGLGLHLAVRQLRDDLRKVIGSSRLKPDDPLIWAAYIHTGA